MGLRPAWKLEVDGRDITDRVRDRLISISTTDQRGERSDRCELAFHDDPPVDFPERGRVLRVHLGWDGQVEETGEYAITRPTSEGPPPIFRVSGHTIGHGGAGAAGPLAVITATREWPENTTIGDMATQMARALGVQAVVSNAVASRPIPGRVVQDGETYVSVLQRQALAVGASFQILGVGENARLVLADHETRSTAGSGRPLPVIRVARTDVVKWSGGIAQIHEVGRVVARWQNTADGTSGEAAEGSSGTTITLRTVYQTEAAAKQAAEAERRRRRAKARTLDLTIQGDPKARYGCELDLSAALRPGLDGTYRVVEARHDLSASGSYLTALKCEAVT